MKFRCSLDASAIGDLDAIVHDYGGRMTDLSQQFLDDFARVLKRIGRFPNAYNRSYNTIRCVRVGRFPYFVAYELCVGEFVVIGVIHEPRQANGPDSTTEDT